ncbi:hypothetical protein ACTJJ0_04050 [Chitinophaga sp. 22321]|uniref:Uncharacterized protein n=1 Tax=Chitinophaga hostae TaxID=2831022 RepID=A0ABS5IXW7_9BACT|nr:hypothetical protein [Chitinophaga hostae]MBS0027814.1 hypothetical protein [Chitinophaga hostae]
MKSTTKLAVWSPSLKTGEHWENFLTAKMLSVQPKKSIQQQMAAKYALPHAIRDSTSQMNRYIASSFRHLLLNRLHL